MQIDFSFPQYKQPGSEDAGTECDTLEFDLKVRCSLSATSLESRVGEDTLKKYLR